MLPILVMSNCSRHFYQLVSTAESEPIILVTGSRIDVKYVTVHNYYTVNILGEPTSPRKCRQQAKRVTPTHLLNRQFITIFSVLSSHADPSTSAQIYQQPLLIQ